MKTCKFKNKSKKIVALMLVLVMIFCFAGCGGTDTDTQTEDSDRVMGTVLGDYVIELPTITEIDYEAGLAKNKEMFAQFGCSAIGKVSDDGDMLIGRSFDLYYSNNPAYVIRTDVEGYYKTVGLAYDSFDGETFDVIKEKGVSQDELLTLIFFTEDIMNEKGLYIEANMRPEQPEYTGISPSTGTNPDAEVSLSFSALVRYLGERCADVDEAVELAQTLNVHGMITDEFCWDGGFFMADESGHYGVMELVDNKLIWLDGQNCQANFYINDEYKDVATIGAGTGRYDLLRSEIDSIQSEDEMTSLIKKVRYTQILSPYTSQFDPRSEYSGFGEGFESVGGELTLEMCQSDEYKDMIYETIENEGAAERDKDVQTLRDEGTQWLSVWQTISNCNNRTIKAIFFEDDELTFDLTVE